MQLTLQDGDDTAPGPHPGATRDAEAARDAALVERVLVGDTDAYSELVTRHMRRAFAIAYRVLEQREDAEDAVQDAFIRALERLDSLDRSRPFGPWLYRIVVNKALNSRRARSVRTVEQIPADTRSTTPSPEQDFERAALRQRLDAAVARLSERQRTIVQLADVDGFTSAEIAAMLDMNDGTVRWHLHQARKALRQMLGPQAGQT